MNETLHGEDAANMNQLRHFPEHLISSRVFDRLQECGASREEIDRVFRSLAPLEFHEHHAGTSPWVVSSLPRWLQKTASFSDAHLVPAAGEGRSVESATGYRGLN